MITVVSACHFVMRRDSRCCCAYNRNHGTYNYSLQPPNPSREDVKMLPMTVPKTSGSCVAFRASSKKSQPFPCKTKALTALFPRKWSQLSQYFPQSHSSVHSQDAENARHLEVKLLTNNLAALSLQPRPNSAPKAAAGADVPPSTTLTRVSINITRSGPILTPLPQ